jgi:Flp pilus assembly protein TadD
MRRILALMALACTFGVTTGQQPNRSPRPLTQGSAAAASAVNKIQNQGNPEYKAPQALQFGTAAAASAINKIQNQGEASGIPAEGRPARKPWVYVDEEKSTVWHEKGKTAFNKKDYKAAIDHFSTAIHFNLKNADSYALRAKSYSLLKKHTEAVADCDKAIDLGVKGPSTAALRKLSAQALADAK